MKARIVKDTLVYSSATFLAKTLGFVRSIVVARFLGPSLYGLWNALSIILEYSRYSSLGVLNAMNREIPFHRGKDEADKVCQIRNMGFSMACVPSFLIGLVLILASIFIGGRARPEVVMALRAIAILVFMKQLYDFFTLLLRSDNNFKFLSIVQILFSILDIALIIMLVARFRFYGFLWAMVLNHVLIVSYIFYRVGRLYRLRLHLDRALLRYLLKIGILMTLIVVVVGLRTTADRLMIIKFLGVTELGYFSISYVLIQFIFLIPSAISQIIYPRLSEKYGSSGGNADALRSYVEVPTLILVYSMPLLIGIIFLLLPFGVRLILPQYIPGIAAAQITILGLFFFSAETMAANFLITTNKMYLYLGLSTIAVVINIVLNYIFLKAGFGITGVAMAGVLLTSFIYTSFLIGFVFHHYAKSVLKTVLYLMKIYLPFFYILVILLALNYSNLNLVVQIIVFSILCLPLLWRLERETGSVSLVFGIVRDAIRGG